MFRQMIATHEFLVTLDATKTLFTWKNSSYGRFYDYGVGVGVAPADII